MAEVLELDISGHADLAFGRNMFDSARLTLARFNLAWLMDGRDDLAVYSTPR